MEQLIGFESVATLVFVLAVALVAGVVKGMVGFAMPMILISGMTLVLPPETALATLILPTLVTNGWQAMRQGLASAMQTVREFKYFLMCGFVFLILSAQFVRVLDPRYLYGFIGILVTVFTVRQLMGARVKPITKSKPVEMIAGAVAGASGGLSGVWGPPTVAFLTAIDTPKQDHMRAQGVIYGLGAVTLAVVHVQTGVLRAETLPLTLAIFPFALVGVWLGFQLQDRIDQKTFRTATLVVLAVAGVNLLRRALIG